MFHIAYGVKNAGWAVGSISDREASVSFTASYLNDSLGQLASAAVSLGQGDGSAIVVFMNEPGEHQLILQRSGTQLSFEVRWFEDWASWGMHPADKFDSLLVGHTCIEEFQDQVRATLIKVCLPG